MTDSVFCFGGRQVDVPGREVTVDGHLRVIEPRPFALLAYLIEQRHRVVSKDELLDKVWPHECVSVGSIARAVMKARQAIDDNGKQALIKTIPRIGYRFVAPLSSGNSTTPHGRDAKSNRGKPAMSVALLPFENLTGEGGLDWVELGLLSLVNRALQNDARLLPISMPSLLTALDSLPARASQTEKAAAVQHLTGARHVINVTIAREGSTYRLDFHMLTLAQTRPLPLYGTEPSELGLRLARAVMAALFSDTVQPTSVGIRLC
jgi:DNA-binding winged helix-turn-helix (wHTH) protein